VVEIIDRNKKDIGRLRGSWQSGVQNAKQDNEQEQEGSSADGAFEIHELCPRECLGVWVEAFGAGEQSFVRKFVRDSSL
jgi:hypothetical protein